MQPTSNDSVTTSDMNFLVRWEESYPSIYYVERTNDYFYVALASPVIYVLMIYVLHQQMKNRKAFKLDKILILWNFGLLLYSLLAAARTIKYITYLKSIYTVVCDQSLLLGNHRAGFWGYTFIWSKVIELGDTVFLVLRKRPILFLHVYHHITVLLYTWFGLGSALPAGGYFAFLNLQVHCIMYLYYLLTSLKIKFSEKLPQFVTAVQILQMVSGITVSVYAIIARYYFELPCAHTLMHSMVSFGLYLSYFILFGKFFFDRYVRKNYQLWKQRRAVQTK